MTPWTVAHQSPLSVGFPGKNTGVGCHLLPLNQIVKLLLALHSLSRLEFLLSLPKDSSMMADRFFVVVVVVCFLKPVL